MTDNYTLCACICAVLSITFWRFACLDARIARTEKVQRDIIELLTEILQAAAENSRRKDNE